MRERAICDVAVEQAKLAGFTGRGEVICHTVAQARVPADWAGYNADDHTLVIEAKKQLDGKLMRQLLRWVDRSNQVMGYIEAPSQVTDEHREKLAILAHAGIGMRYVHDCGSIDIVLPAVFKGEVDTRILLAAIQAAPADSGPPAGSAAAKRLTPSRCKWTPATEYVGENEGCTATDIKRDAELSFNPTAAAMRKAIDDREWLGVRYEGHSITKFYPKETIE